MSLNRRELIVLSAVLATGCQRESKSEQPPAASQPASTTQPLSRELIVDAGPANNYSQDGVYDQFRDQGFFIITRGGKLFALSATCTHKGCKVRVLADQAFLCKCHGSTFDPNGNVTHGPAMRNLPRLGLLTDDRNHLMVNLKGFQTALKL